MDGGGEQRTHERTGTGILTCFVPGAPQEDQVLAQHVKQMDKNGKGSWKRVAVQLNRYGACMILACAFLLTAVSVGVLPRGSRCPCAAVLLFLSVAGNGVMHVIFGGTPCRTTKQCRERWINILDPAIKKTPWTAEELDILFTAQAELGNKWAEIAQRLPGRPEASVKNKFYAHSRRVSRLDGRGRGKRPGEGDSCPGSASHSPELSDNDVDDDCGLSEDELVHQVEAELRGVELASSVVTPRPSPSRHKQRASFGDRDASLLVYADDREGSVMGQTDSSSVEFSDCEDNEGDAGLSSGPAPAPGGPTGTPVMLPLSLSQAALQASSGRARSATPTRRTLKRPSSDPSMRCSAGMPMSDMATLELPSPMLDSLCSSLDLQLSATSALVTKRLKCRREEPDWANVYAPRRACIKPVVAVCSLGREEDDVQSSGGSTASPNSVLGALSSALPLVPAPLLPVHVDVAATNVEGDDAPWSYLPPLSPFDDKPELAAAEEWMAHLSIDDLEAKLSGIVPSRGSDASADDPPVLSL